MELSSSSRYHPQLLHSNQPFREKAGEKAERHIDYKQFLFLSSHKIFILIMVYNYNLGIEVMKTKRRLCHLWGERLYGQFQNVLFELRKCQKSQKHYRLSQWFVETQSITCISRTKVAVSIDTLKPIALTECQLWYF